MKKAIVSFGIMLTMAFAANAQDQPASATPNIDPNAPKFQFVTETVDYGTIEQGADGNRVFKFKNTGKTPLVITNAQGSCGCTTPDWPKEPIKPGAEAVIKVHYDTNRVGNFQKNVTLTSNASEPSKVLTIKGVVNAKPAAPAEQVTPAPGVK